MSNSGSTTVIHLEAICIQAMEIGRRIDLSGCPYGGTTGPCAFIGRPTNYYFLLAGLVKLERLGQILEIGTNCGGSIMSMSQGIDKRDMAVSRLVTVDIARKNEEGIKRYPHIRRVDGDALSEDVVRKTIGLFERDIDLLFIDSLHEYEHTKKSIEIYGGKLNPRYLVLDDIRQCDDMIRLWKELCDRFEDNAFDASEVSIRKGAGFGVIRWR
ncbi:MAG: class I SAM-dependent methyltransferase [Candidatus Omnitrophota bacterium]